MPASLAELVRPTQTSKSLAQHSALTSTAKPKTRFDDVLSQHRPAEPRAPKADRPERASQSEHAAKSEKSKKADAAKSKSEKPVQDAQPADDTAEDISPTDEAETEEAEASKPSENPTKNKPTKAVKKTDENGEAITDGALTEVAETDAETSADPVAELPTGELSADVEDVKDDGKKPVADEKSDDEQTQIDPNELLAQLVAPSQPATDDQPMTADADNTADATAEVTNVTGVSEKAHTQATRAQAGPRPSEATNADLELAVQPHAVKGHHEAEDQLPAEAEEAASAIQLPPEFAKADSKSSADAKIDPSAALQAIAGTHEKGASHPSALPAVQQAEAPLSQRTVAEENVDRIVTSVRGEIATKGGTMQIRLDPPSLGAINVQISIDDGVMSASLQTNNDEATRLLSHNLAQLKSQLESAGVTVDRIQVKQSTPAEQSSSSNQQGESSDRQQSRDAGQDQSARQEQQRREMLQRMWAKLAGNGDPLDLVA